MRKLRTSDIFSAARVLTALNVKEDIKKIALESQGKKKAQDNVGFEVLYTLFERAVEKNSERRIYEFLSGIFEISPEEVEKLPPTECINKALEAADIEEWKAFFTSVASLIRKN